MIGPHGAHLPLSNKKIRTQGFSGKMQTLKFTEPLDLAIDSQRVVMPLLYSESCPVNLLGRDILCKLNADIKCTPDGVLVDFPAPVWQMFLTEVEQEPTTQLPSVYWLKLMEPHLFDNYMLWRTWIQAIRPEMTEVVDDLHCTLLYDPKSAHGEYDFAWKDCMEGRTFLVVTGDLIIGPQGVAVYAELDSDVTQWYKVQDAVPHVSLMVSKDCQPKDLGPMMKASKEVNWIKTDNKYIHRSADGAYYRIAMKSVDRTVAEKVLVDRFQPASHYVLTEEQEEILKQVPDELWTKHHTDVGLVKSAG